MNRSLFAAASLLALSLSVAACKRDGDAAVGEEHPNSPAQTSAPRHLPAEWYEDSDNNAIPNFLESRIGFNPAADDCPLSGQCGDGANGGNLNMRPNVLLILDSSGSMAARMGGPRKIDHAKQALASFVGGMPGSVKLGMMVYGHRGDNSAAGKAQSCPGIDLLAPIGSIRPATVPSLMARFEPRGWTPIAASLEKAREAFAGKTGNRIILVSDGVETCGGDPAKVAASLKASGLDVQVDVVGFDVGSTDAAALRQIAEAGGGQYFNARTRRELDEYLNAQNRAAAQSLGDGVCELKRSNENMLCDGRMRVAATRALSEQARTLSAAGNRQGEQEVREVSRKVNAYFDSRKKERQAILQRADQLAKKGFGTVNQTLDNLEQVKR